MTNEDTNEKDLAMRSNDDGPKGGIRFDPTINAGHILTFVAMAISVMSSYAILDKRIGVLEERSNAAILLAADKQVEQKDALKEIRTDVKDLQRSLNDISRTLAARK